MASMKGSAFTARFNYLRSRFPTKWDALVASFDPQTQALARGPCLKATWYPFSCFIDLNTKADQICGRNDFALVREMGRHASKTNMPVLYKAFFRVGSPDYLFGKVVSIWRQHHDTGRVVFDWDGVNRASYQVHEFASPNAMLCRSLEGFLQGVLEVMGMKDVQVTEAQCRLRGAPYCEFASVWRP
jgi:predicted hydrocarbon binding protein